MARSVYYFTDSSEVGGAEEALLLLLAHLDRDRFPPTLLYHAGPAGDELAGRARELGAAVRAVPPLPLGLRGAAGVPRLARALARARPDLFHAHLSWPLAAKYPLAAALLARVPAAVATVQLFPEIRLGPSSRLQLRALAARLSAYVAVSHALGARLTGELGWPPAKLEVIHNGVDPARVRRPRDPALRRELGGDGGFVVLAVARLHAQKGLGDLLRAAAELPEARFALAGEGPERARLEAEAGRLGVGDRVRFLGRRADVPELLAAADAFVLPSLYEGSPLAVLEAMAAGLPLVATAVGGTGELVADGESGLLVPPRDPPALARALRRLLAEPETRERLGAAARRRAEAFTAAATAGRVMALYERLLGPGGRGGGGRA